MPKVILKIPPVAVDKKLRRIPHNFANQRMHWAVKYKWNKAWKEAVQWEIMLNRAKFGKLPLKFARIIVYFKVVHIFDQDGAYTACKAIVDGLKGTVIVDDNPKNIDLVVKTTRIGCLLVAEFIHTKY